jgi:hypothetical protein
MTFESTIEEDFNAVLFKWLDSLGIKLKDRLPPPEIMDDWKRADFNVGNSSYISPYFSLTENGYYFYESEKAKYYFQQDYLSFEEMWSFIKKNDRGIENIKDYLGKRYISYDKKLIYYIINGGGPSHATPTEITLCFVKEKLAEYIHETVHCISGFYSPVWLSEGLAVYVDSMFSEWITPPAYGMNLHMLAKKYIIEEGGQELLDLADSLFSAPITPEDQERRIKAYTAAGSLTKYIEETYGKENLLKLYSNYGNISYILGDNIKTIKENWLDFLINY